MIQGIKVDGQPDMRRTRHCAGLIVNSNTEAYQATVQARERVSGLENQVAVLTKLLNKSLGIEAGL